MIVCIMSLIKVGMGKQKTVGVPMCTSILIKMVSARVIFITNKKSSKNGGTDIINMNTVAITAKTTNISACRMFLNSGLVFLF